MTQNEVISETEASLFLQRHSAAIRIWHWLTFIFITTAMITVLLNATLSNARGEVVMVKEQLKSKGAEVTDEQAFAVSHQYEEIVWGVHKLVGYGIAILLLSRIIIETLVPGDEKMKTRFKSALGFYKKGGSDKENYKHYLGIKTSYLIFYVLLTCIALTGLSMAFGRELGISRELRGTIKEIHSIGQYFMYGFVVIHLTGVVVTEILKANGLVSGMINGNKK
jgi:cytochrome b561